MSKTEKKKLKKKQKQQTKEGSQPADKKTVKSDSGPNDLSEMLFK